MLSAEYLGQVEALSVLGVRMSGCQGVRVSVRAVRVLEAKGGSRPSLYLVDRSCTWILHFKGQPSPASSCSDDPHFLS